MIAAGAAVVRRLSWLQRKYLILIEAVMVI